MSVLIGTLGTRTDELGQVLDAFAADSEAGGYEIEVILECGRSWGANLNAAAEVAKGDYWFLGCDDVAPWLGWFAAARELLDEGLTPCSRYFHPDGKPLHPVDLTSHREPVPWCRSFLIKRKQAPIVFPMLDATWYADIRASEQLRAAGYELVACDGYCFTHLGTERDWLTRDEEDRQRTLYESTRL